MPPSILILTVAAIVIGSTAWVFFDARRLGATNKASLLTNSPPMWFVGCLLMWSLAFPLYLIARSQAIRAHTCTSSDVIAIADARELFVEHAQHGLARWLDRASLLLGCASIPCALLVGVSASPAWASALGLSMWSVMSGSRQAFASGGALTGIVGWLATLLMTDPSISLAT